MSAVHQFLPSFAEGDAIGAHARGLQRILRDAGYRSDIYADEIHPAARRWARPWRQFDHDADGSEPARLLYHLSTGSPMAAALAERAGPDGLDVYYHNITPAEFFDRWEPAGADSVGVARQQMRKLASSARLAMANSAFSEAELRREGYADTAVVPLAVDFSAYDVDPDPAAAARLASAGAGGDRWLFVGRVAPNKCQHDVIAAFAVYRKLFGGAARLTLIGGKTSSLYHRALVQLVDELDLGGAVEVADRVGFAELVAHYRAATVFVCASEHEGFCVPLVEAMHFGVPVVAFGAAAVPETVGDAGVCLPAKDPVLVATAVHRVRTDEGLRRRLVDAGRARAEHFSFAETARRFLDVYGQTAGRRAGAPTGKQP
ncbi:MAG: glycosyltransferase [Acidimicrobiia bacterium]